MVVVLLEAVEDLDEAAMALPEAVIGVASEDEAEVVLRRTEGRPSLWVGHHRKASNDKEDSG